MPNAQPRPTPRPALPALVEASRTMAEEAYPVQAMWKLVAALRTAVTVAQAMTNQRLVIEQIGALNSTTDYMIDSTGELLKTQTGAIH